MSARPTPWPTEDELLLLHASLLDAPDALAAWRRFREIHEGIDHLGGDAARLLPLLFRNLQSAGAVDPSLGILKGAYRQSWYANTVLLDAATRAVSVLRAAEIDVLLVDRGALVALHSSNLGVRPLEAVDLLVRRSEAARARELLDGLGGLRVRSSRASDDRLWGHAVHVSIRGVDVRVPDPADQLLLTCADGLGWSPSALRWIPDAVLLTRLSPVGIDWDRLVSAACERSLTLEVTSALVFLRSEFPFELPEATLTDLRRNRAGALAHLLLRIRATPEPNAFARIVRRAARRWDPAARLSP